MIFGRQGDNITRLHDTRGTWYICPAVNFKTFVFYLLAEPMFTVPPEPKVRAFTEQLTELKCVVEGFPPPKVEWRRQGNKELPFGRHYIRNNNLYLQNPIKEDEDIYMCHASTPAGSVMGATEVTVETYGKMSVSKVSTPYRSTSIC